MGTMKAGAKGFNMCKLGRSRASGHVKPIAVSIISRGTGSMALRLKEWCRTLFYGTFKDSK